jgi:hypothetical protein
MSGITATPLPDPGATLKLLYVTPIVLPGQKNVANRQHWAEPIIGLSRCHRAHSPLFDFFGCENLLVSLSGLSSAGY